MAEAFRLAGERAELSARLEHDFGCLDEFAGADGLNRLLVELRQAGFLEAPPGLEVIVYPSAVEDSWVAVITVFSTVRPDAHVVAASEDVAKLADPEAREVGDAVAFTVAVLEGAIALANMAVGAVRRLEHDAVGRVVVARARCPRCGVEGSLRVEYRRDVLGLAADGGLVSEEGGAPSEILCLACGEEVDDVLAGAPVGSGAGGGARA
jgi:hypothetical protein